MTATPHSDVLVVAAGFAGLYAARLLKRTGIAVTVLEIRDRFEGRALSQRTVDNSTVDLGAQWLGPGQKRMYAMAKEFWLKTITTHTQGETVFEIEGCLQRVSSAVPPITWLAKLDAFQIGWRSQKRWPQSAIRSDLYVVSEPSKATHPSRSQRVKDLYRVTGFLTKEQNTFEFTDPVT